MQERLLGVGRHGHEDTTEAGTALAHGGPAQAGRAPPGPTRIYISNPKLPTRWSQPVPAAQIEAQARTASAPVRRAADMPQRGASVQSTAGSEPFVVIAGTLDTKGDELRFIRDILKDAGLRTRLVDLSTSGKPSGADVPPIEVALNHPRGAAGLFTGDRGTSVAAMAQAFEAWTKRQTGVAGIISAGGSGGTAMVAPAMRSLPVGVPKVLISTVASGNVQAYVGPSDIMMMYSVTDVQGLNSISRQVLANGAQAMAGMVRQRLAEARTAQQRRAPEALPAIGLTMFGVTTACVQQVTAQLKGEYDCLVFHATGIGGQSMEKLVDLRLLSGVIDVTTTEICDMMMGGVFPATEDRFGAIIRARLPYVGSVGALDMVNFGAPETVPERYKGRTFYPHNPQVTLMRTTAEENERMGRWIGERLNRMEAPVRFLLPEGGVSALDAPGQAFHDPAADAALFKALEQTVRRTSSRQLIRLPLPHQRPAVCRGRWWMRSARSTATAGCSAAGRGALSHAALPAIRAARQVQGHGGPRRAHRRRRRRHRPLRQVPGGRRHRPDRHLQLRPLPYGRARLARRAAGLRRRQPDRGRDGGRGAARGQAHAGAGRRQRHRPVPADGRVPRPAQGHGFRRACRTSRPSASSTAPSVPISRKPACPTGWRST